MRFSTLLIVTTAFVETGHGLKLVPLTRSVDVSDTVVGSPVKLSETTGPIDRYISNTTHNTDIGPTFHIAAIVFDPKNGANDAMWAKYISKGEHNICLMKATDAGAGFLESDPRNPPSSASKWTGDLRDASRKWFWHENAVQDNECDFERQRLKGPWDSLSLSPKPRYGGGENDCYFVGQYDAKVVPLKIFDQKYKVDGKEYTATGGFYQFLMNRNGGLILGMNYESPKLGTIYNWGDRKATASDLPDLHFCSDILWGWWVRDNANVKTLRMYGAQNVVNDETSLISARILKKNNADRLTPWPGNQFDASTEEGKALIGSPIGATIAHLLKGHKAELGIKHITKVTICTGDARPGFPPPKHTDLHVFFHIEDVPPDKGTGHKGGKNEGTGVALDSRTLHVRKEGKDFVREHVFKMS